MELNGYDYENQAWVLDGRYVRCAHTECQAKGEFACFGTRHEGEQADPELVR